MPDTTTTTAVGAASAASPVEFSQPRAAANPDPTPTAEAAKGGKEAVLADLAKERKARQAAQERLKELEPLAAKARELEDAQKSELERLTDAAAQARKDADDARSEVTRLRVAAESGLPADLHEFLTGGDEESLRAQAQKLMAATATPTADPRRPVPDPSQGAKPGDGTHNQLTRADLAGKSPEWIEAAREAGRLNELLGIK